MAAHTFVVLVLVLFGVCSADNRKQCLQCERVAKPQDCLQRIKCAQDEVCFTERYITQEGHAFYDMGCKLRSTCQRSNYLVSQAELNQRLGASGKPFGRRQSPGEPMAAHVCEECCDGDHCNNLLCGGHEAKGLKCVSCLDMENMDNCEKVKGCQGHEMCFVAERITDRFELLYSSGCMREIQCLAYAREKKQGGIFDPCFKCCNDTFCNSHCEDVTTPMPTTTVNMASTNLPAATFSPSAMPNAQTTQKQTPPMPAKTTAKSGPTIAPPSMAATGTAGPGLPTPKPSSNGPTPPPIAG